jgi:hypothetical protein
MRTVPDCALKRQAATEPPFPAQVHIGKRGPGNLHLYLGAVEAGARDSQGGALPSPLAPRRWQVDRMNL